MRRSTLVGPISKAPEATSAVPARAVGGLCRERVEGGLAGVLVGEALGHGPDPVPAVGSVGAALVDLCSSYTVDGWLEPIEVAYRHRGVSGPAWLLPVAIVHPDPGRAAHETRALAVAAAVADPAINDWARAADPTVGDWVIYVHDLVTSPSNGQPGGWPRLWGDPGVDAVTAARWAITPQRSFEDLVTALVGRATPSVVAAAAGAWGLTHGARAIPPRYRTEHSPRRARWVAAALLRARKVSVAAAEPDGAA